MQKTLYSELLKYKKLDRSSFHTPGHKNHFYENYDLLSLDYTELPMTDSLYEASGIIRNSEKEVSKLYGSKATFFSSGGNTLCIQAMFRMCAGNGDYVLCDRLVHRSAVSAMALLGINPIWLKRNFKNGIAWDIDIEDLKTKIRSHSNIKAIYLTSPNYYGVMQDISLISSICKEFKIPILVDNAHGSHLKFLGLHPLDLGATMTADSAHKTLPVLTGGAWLHVNDEKFVGEAKSAMALFGSTSPSYPVMASMDLSRSWLSKNGIAEYKKLAEKVKNLKKLSKVENFFLEAVDPTRISINARSVGLSGFELREHFYKFKIEPEMCDKDYAVLIATPFNCEKDWKRLELAIKSIKPRKEVEKNLKNFEMHIPPCVKPISESIMSESKKVAVKDSEGEIAANIVCPCPPGVPVVMPGEKIGPLEKKALEEYGILEIDVLK